MGLSLCDDPTTCRSVVACHQEYHRADWHARVDTEVSATCDAAHFYVRASVKAYERGEIVEERGFEETIRRDCMRCCDGPALVATTCRNGT